MISTKELNKLPTNDKLRKICKSISVLDAILCQDWEYRYYSYNSKWGSNEEVFEMRNGEGDQMLILFQGENCVINAFAHEFYNFEKNTPSKQNLTSGLPCIFNEFIFGEPIKSIGTTFCVWSTDSLKWQTGKIEINDGSEEILSILDGDPQTYINWATDYFENSYKESGIPFQVVKDIYSGKILTTKMVLSVVEDIEDWEQLENDLHEINYPYNFEDN